MAITTAGDIIRKALGVILVLGQQDVLSSSDEQDGLDSLNTLLESWRLERLSCFAQRQENFPLVAGTATYTIGPGGNFNTDRPVRLIDAYVLYQTVSFPILLITQQQYDAVPVKTIQGLPTALFYNPQFPVGSITMLPVPYTSGIQLYITSFLEIQSFAAVTDALSLPPGYNRALIYNLAVELAPIYGKSVAPEIAAIAVASKRNIKRINYQMQPASFDGALYGDQNGRRNFWGNWLYL
jgi:hypothetical protein